MWYTIFVYRCGCALAGLNLVRCISGGDQYVCDSIYLHKTHDVCISTLFLSIAVVVGPQCSMETQSVWRWFVVPSNVLCIIETRHYRDDVLACLACDTFNWLISWHSATRSRERVIVRACAVGSNST